MSERVLFVSPHLDDVVLSCPAHVLEAVVRGADVVVATVFSEGGSEHAARREEDSLACASLGAHALHLGLLDAPWRRGHEPTFRALILEDRPRDAEDLEAVRRALGAVIDQLHPTHVFAPLGVGDHVDHRLVHAASHGGPLSVARFYEDQPYASVAHAVAARLGQPVDLVSYRAALASAPMISVWLPEGPDRERALDAVVAIRQPRRSYRVSSSLALDAQAIAVSRAAQSHYASQLPSLSVDGILPAPLETIWTR